MTIPPLDSLDRDEWIPGDDQTAIVVARCVAVDDDDAVLLAVNGVGNDSDRRKPLPPGGSSWVVWSSSTPQLMISREGGREGAQARVWVRRMMLMLLSHVSLLLVLALPHDHAPRERALLLWRGMKEHDMLRPTDGRPGPSWASRYHRPHSTQVVNPPSPPHAVAHSAPPLARVHASHC